MRIILCTMLLVSIIIAGCARETTQNLPETPTPPLELQSLPKNARIDCPNNADPSKGQVVIWELPGVEPTDRNSAYCGRRGEELGVLPDCTDVVITDCAWSTTDQEFWVLIETQDLTGWVTLDLVDID